MNDKLTPLKKIEAAIGHEAFERLLESCAGCRFYIPKNFINRQERNANILADYDAGYTRHELAQIYKLSISTIDNITAGRANKGAS